MFSCAVRISVSKSCPFLFAAKLISFSYVELFETAIITEHNDGFVGFPELEM